MPFSPFVRRGECTVASLSLFCSVVCVVFSVPRFPPERATETDSLDPVPTDRPTDLTLADRDAGRPIARWAGSW